MVRGHDGVRYVGGTEVSHYHHVWRRDRYGAVFACGRFILTVPEKGAVRNRCSLRRRCVLKRPD